MSSIFLVIPTYNAEKYIGECLEALINQSFTDWSAVIINDGSVDGSLSIAEEFSRREPRIMALDFPNGGVAVARNRGISRIPDDAECVMFLDNDDYLEPNALEVLKGTLDSNPCSCAVYALPRFVQAAGEPITTNIENAYGIERLRVSGKRLAASRPEEKTDFSCFVVWCHIATPGQVLIRASSLRSAGEFDTNTNPSDDWDMWLRLSTINDFVFIRQFLINKRTHGENVSGKGKVMATAEPVIRLKLRWSDSLSADQKNMARRGQLLSCEMKLRWAKEALNLRNWRLAARQTYRAIRSYQLYSRTWR